MRLRSTTWIAGDGEVAMSHRVALRFDPEDQGKPLVGIADTSSSLNPCNDGFGALMPHVERGIREAGGVPFRFPVMSLGEDLMKPSAMLYRNLTAMEIEETVRSNPLDAMVLMANCDKSVPAAIMAAASTDLPSAVLFGGARKAPEFRGTPLGSGTTLWRALEDRRAGLLNDEEWRGLEACLSCAGPGSCNTMGTASTMAAITETLGMCLPGSTGMAADGAELEEYARRTGELVVDHVRNDVRPSDRITQRAIDNAAVVLAALGGSTNAVIHLAAIAGRLGLAADLHRLNELWQHVPLLADIEPCGSQLIQRFRSAGGVAALVRSLESRFDVTVKSADGTPWSQLATQAPPPDGTIRPHTDPILPAPTMAAVFGSLAPDGAVIKVAAASPGLLEHTGRAVVFDTYSQMRERLDDEAEEFKPTDVIVIRGCGPVGAPGMPEWGMAPIPQKLARAGVRDMVRISDGRMSGTSFGTVVLHVAPEAAIDGPLAKVRDGDLIKLDVAARSLDLLVDDTELRNRDAVVPAGPNRHLRGWPRLYQQHVMQAPAGCDFDILAAPTSDHRKFVEPTVGRS